MASGHQNERHWLVRGPETGYPGQGELAVTQLTEIDVDLSATQHHVSGAPSVY